HSVLSPPWQANVAWAGAGVGGCHVGLQVPAVPGGRQLQAAAQHLAERRAELLRGHVVQQRVDDGAQVEEGVGDGEQQHVGAEVGPGPVVLGLRRGHEPPHLVGQPAERQGHHDQPCGREGGA
uniref:Uncharacterized protein n=1 Tax=Canis lupus dingo TaxID=286419 RepID=A0A8C0KNY2_CANLU